MKKKLPLIPKLALAGALALGALTAPTFSRPLPPPTDCPLNYAPVICSNGQVYSNSCFASAAGATDCVPYGGDI